MNPGKKKVVKAIFISQLTILLGVFLAIALSAYRNRLGPNYSNSFQIDPSIQPLLYFIDWAVYIIFYIFSILAGYVVGRKIVKNGLRYGALTGILFLLLVILFSFTSILLSDPSPEFGPSLGIMISGHVERNLSALLLKSIFLVGFTSLGGWIGSRNHKTH